MPNYRLTEFDQLIWRYLRDAGGWHSAREIAASLTLCVEQRRRLACTMARLKKGGHVVQRPTLHGDEAYGVTARCAAVPGESLEPEPIDI